MGREELAKQRKMVEDRIADATRSRLLDRFGRPIMVDGEYYFIPSQPMVYKVASITPVLDTKMPPGLFQVKIVSTIMVGVVANQKNEEFTLVNLPTAITQAELLNDGDGADEGQQDQPPAADAPADPHKSQITLTDLDTGETLARQPEQVADPTNTTGSTALRIVPPTADSTAAEGEEGT